MINAHFVVDIFILQRHASLGKHALNFKDMKVQIQQLTQDTSSQEKKPTAVTITVSTTSIPETEEESSDEGEYTIEEEDGELVIQPQTFMFDKMLKFLQHLDKEEKDSSVQTTQLQETSCELTREKFQNSIFKILPDTAEFPEDLFNVEGCVWCGSRNHSVFDCLGYITWLTQYFHLEQHRISYEEKLQVKKRIMDRAKECHNPRRPWEL